MASRETKVITVFIGLTVLCLYLLAGVNTPPLWAAAAVTIGVGVIAPLLVKGYLDRHQ